MRIGVSTAVLQPYMETEQAIDKIKELGADCVEVVLRTFYEYRPEFSKSVNFDGIRVSCVRTDCNHFEKSMFVQSRRVRGDSLYWLDQVVRSFEYSGCKTYCFGYVEEGNEGALIHAQKLCARYKANLGVDLKRGDEGNNNLLNTIPELRTAITVCDARELQTDDFKNLVNRVDVVRVYGGEQLIAEKSGFSKCARILKKLKLLGFDGDVILGGPDILPATPVVPVNEKVDSILSNLRNALTYLRKYI